MSVTYLESSSGVTAYVEGKAVGYTTKSEFGHGNGIGRRVKWGVTCSFTERGGYGYTKAKALARLKKLVKEQYAS